MGDTQELFLPTLKLDQRVGHTTSIFHVIIYYFVIIKFHKIICVKPYYMLY